MGQNSRQTKTSVNWVDYITQHSETPPGENQNLFETLTVRVYVWSILNWTLQQSMTISTERRVLDLSYLGETQSLPWYAICST